jgi:hypothetical protein
MSIINELTMKIKSINYRKIPFEREKKDFLSSMYYISNFSMESKTIIFFLNFEISYKI